MRRVFVVAMLFALVSATTAWAQTDVFAPMRFLLGDWTAIDTPAGESGAFVFKLALQDHLIIRTNEAKYAATADRAASRHDDLLVIYAEGGSLKADYFDSEGHVIRYAVQAPEPNVVVFLGDKNPRQPRYRLTYRAGAGDVLLGSFEVASPDSQDVFKPYLSWKARKR